MPKFKKKSKINLKCVGKKEMTDRERVNVEPGNLKISFKTKQNARLLYLYT